MLFGPPGDKSYQAPPAILESFPDPIHLVVAELLWKGQPRKRVSELAAQAGLGHQSEFTELYQIRAPFVAAFLLESAETLAGKRARAYVDQLIDNGDSLLHRSLSYVMSLREDSFRVDLGVILGDRLLEMSEEGRPGITAARTGRCIPVGHRTESDSDRAVLGR